MPNTKKTDVLNTLNIKPFVSEKSPGLRFEHRQNAATALK